MATRRISLIIPVAGLIVAILISTIVTLAFTHSNNLENGQSLPSLTPIPTPMPSPAPKATLPTSTASPAERSHEEDPGGLTLDLLRNLEYYHSFCKVPTRLKNGVFGWSKNFRCNQESPTGFLFKIYNDKVAFGDLDSDGDNDAVLILTTFYGGSGNFRELAVVLNHNGTLSHITSIDLGDRTIIESITIDEETIILDMVTHHSQDGACCPTKRVIREYEMSGNQVHLLREILLPDDPSTVEVFR